MLPNMPQNTVTFIGVLATDVVISAGQDNDEEARFRLMLQARRMDRVTDTWTTDRTFVSVACKRRLARNVADQLRRGDPVLVTGTLRTKRRDGRVPKLEIDADAVGLDLSRLRNEQQPPLSARAG